VSADRAHEHRGTGSSNPSSSSGESANFRFRRCPRPNWWAGQGLSEPLFASASWLSSFHRTGRRLSAESPGSQHTYLAQVRLLAATDDRVQILLLPPDEATEHRAAISEMAAFPHPGDSELADVGPLWGIFAHPTFGQPPAADRRVVIPVNAVAVTHKRKPKATPPQSPQRQSQRGAAACTGSMAGRQTAPMDVSGLECSLGEFFVQV